MPRPVLTYAFIASGLIHLSSLFIVAFWIRDPLPVLSPQAILIEVIEVPLTSSSKALLLPPVGKPLTPPTRLRAIEPVPPRPGPPSPSLDESHPSTPPYASIPLLELPPIAPLPSFPQALPGAEDGSAASQPSLGGEGGSQSVEGAGAALTATGAGQKGDVKSSRPAGGYQVKPWYPESARQEGIQGTTELKVLVRANGSVGQVLVAKSAGHFDLDRAAVEALKTWRFEPARRGKEPVAVWVMIPVEFRLE